jgi:acetyl esterase
MRAFPTSILKSFALLMVLLFEQQIVHGQSKLLYKTVGKDSLYIEFQLPESKSDQAVPLIVFYFGGGWNTGTIEQFRPHAEYFSQRGLATALVDYRVLTKHGTSPFASLRDAKSAIRFLRAHADSLGIDQDRIIASGGSAGGHLAAATALIEGYNDPRDNMDISCKPNALVLFNPVIDNGPAGYGYERIMEQYLSFSPLHNIRKGAPPTIILIGTEDNLIPVETVEYFTMAMKKVGSTCELRLYEGQKHGFFNHRNTENYQKTIKEADSFIQSLGWLKEE